MGETAIETVAESVAPPIERDAANGQFTKGNRGGPGRPKGSRNKADILLDALPAKARQWVKSDSPAILSEARQLIAKDDPRVSLPSDKPALMSGSPTVAIIVMTPEQLRTWHTPVESASRNPASVEMTRTPQITVVDSTNPVGEKGNV